MLLQKSAKSVPDWAEDRHRTSRIELWLEGSKGRVNDGSKDRHQ
jgi:hypothetical protein